MVNSETKLVLLEFTCIDYYDFVSFARGVFRKQRAIQRHTCD
jgi:hypothetical protein